MDCIRSPQSSWECSRILLPVVRIGNRQLNLQGKAYAILWEIMLLAGPSFESIRMSLTRVVSITTDFGTE
eukprot:7985233-Pyramimonas_sp.AAC.1